MGSEGESSSTRRVSVPSTVRCVEAIDDKDGVAPTCKCGVYAILYKSRTPTNPNRLFLGCPFFKLKNLAHCKFFVWLDDHLAKIGGVKKSVSDLEVDDAKEYLCQKTVEGRLVTLEKKIAYLEGKKFTNVFRAFGCLFAASCFAAIYIQSFK